jgi:hypothetical protein
MYKKAKLFFICILFLGLNGAFSQEIIRSQSGLKPDLRLLEKTTEEHNFDVIHYAFDWTIDFDSHSIQGDATLEGESSIHGLNSITLNLMNTMTVAEVTQNERPLSYSHQPSG